MRWRTGIAAIAAIGLIGASSVPSQRPNLPEKITSDHGGREEPLLIKVIPADSAAAEALAERQARQREIEANWWMVRLTLVLTFLAFVQVVVTGITLRGLKHARTAAEAADVAAETAKRSVEIATDTARKQLRAYIRQSSASIAGLVVGQRPIITIEFDNVGQTPAHDVVSWLGVNFRTEPGDPEFELPGDVEEFSRSSMAPGNNKSLNLPTRIWDQADQVAFDEGRLRIFAYGEIRYRDVFENEWTTCFRLLHERTRREGHFGTCTAGNYST